MTPGIKAAPRLAGMLFVFVLAVCAAAAARAAPSASVVMDARSGEILFARNHDTRLHPASLTKMMTLYIAFEAVQRGEITMDTMVRVSANAAGEPCSCLGLRTGQTIALRYLVRAAAVRSANDAATAIAEAISGSEAAFAERMTRTARAMGMNNTTFRNAHGLTHAQHLSTARDMTTLGRQLFFDFPQYYNLFSRRSTDAGIATVNNTNRRFLDAYRGADGIKTGYTRAAGFNLVGSAERGGKRIIATVFGGTSVAQRNSQMAELLDMGFERAPVQVAVRRPPAPNYGGTAVASAQPSGDVAVARTVRLQTTVARSPIPPARPTRGPAAPPEELLVAIADGINAAVAEIADEAVAEPPFEVVADLPPLAAEMPAPRPEDAPFAVADAETEMLADDNTDEEIADALAVAALAAAGAPPRPDGLVPDSAAETADVARAASNLNGLDAIARDEPQDIALALTAAEALDSGAALAHAATAVPQPAPRPEIDEPNTAAAPVLPALAAAAPPARGLPRDIVLTSSLGAPRIDAAAVQSDTPPEVVARTVSTSDTRLWGVQVGRYGSRFEAERALIQTALSELTTLDGAVRRVQQRSGGFEAHFVGLTQAQADAACRRLQARDRVCSTLTP